MKLYDISAMDSMLGQLSATRTQMDMKKLPVVTVRPAQTTPVQQKVRTAQVSPAVAARAAAAAMQTAKAAAAAPALALNVRHTIISKPAPTVVPTTRLLVSSRTPPTATISPTQLFIAPLPTFVTPVTNGSTPAYNPDGSQMPVPQSNPAGTTQTTTDGSGGSVQTSGNNTTTSQQTDPTLYQGVTQGGGSSGGGGTGTSSSSADAATAADASGAADQIVASQGADDINVPAAIADAQPKSGLSMGWWIAIGLGLGTGAYALLKRKQNR